MKKLTALLCVLLTLSVGITGCSLFNSVGESNNRSDGTSKNTASSVNTSIRDATGNAASSTTITGKAEWKTAIYYPDSASLYIQKEQKTFEIPTNASLEYKVGICMDELVNSPRTAIPKNTRVLSASQEENTLKLNLSKEFDEGINGGSAAINMALGQIVLTFTEFPGIDNVSLLIDSKVVQEFKGHIELDRLLARSEYIQFMGNQ